MTYPTFLDLTVYADLRNDDDVIVLDGTTGQYIIENPLTTGGAISAFTIEFWLQTPDLANAGTPVSYARTGQLNEILLKDYRDLELTVGGTGSGATGIAVNDDVPHHVAVSWQASDGAAQILIDGQLRWSGTLATGNLTDGGSFVVGQRQGSVGGSFADSFLGMIWDVRLWLEVRTRAPIFHHMNHRALGSETNLELYWKLDEGTGSTATDATSNGHDGSIVGGSGVWTQTELRFFTDISGYLNLHKRFSVVSALTGQIDTADFSIEDADTVAPADWDEVVIYDGDLDTGVRIFGGFILDLLETEGANAGRDFQIGCSDYTAWLDKVIIKEYYEDVDDDEIIVDLFDTYAPEYDVSTYVDFIRYQDKIRFNRRSIRQALDLLAQFAAGDWYVDYEKRIHYFRTEIPPSPHALSDNPDMSTSFPYGNFRKKTDGAGVVNRVEVVGGNYLSDDMTFYLEGTGQDPVIQMPFKMHGPEAGGALQVWRNDGSEGTPSWTAMTVKVGHIDTLGGATEVLHYFQEQNLEQQSDWPQLANAVKIFGRFEVPLRTKARDQPSFDHYKRWFDDVIDNPDIVDKLTAKLAARARMAGAALDRVDIKCDTREPGIFSGMLQPFVNANAGIDGDYLVQRSQAKLRPGGRVVYTLSLGTYSPDLIDVLLQLARQAKGAPAWRDDEVLDEILDVAEDLTLSDGTPTVTARNPSTDPYLWRTGAEAAGHFHWGYFKWIS